MDKQAFWEIIATSQRESTGSMKSLTARLTENLAELSVDDLLHFQFLYEVHEIIVIKSTSHLIWNALFLINGGYCTNTYGFAGWLIAQGEPAYFAAFRDADSLSELGTKIDACNYEGLRFLAAKTYKEKANVKVRAYNKLLSDFWCTDVAQAEAASIEKSVVYGGVARNADWTISELQLVLPRLWEKHRVK
jgi:Protein of unknown function (DUF4240)